MSALQFDPAQEKDTLYTAIAVLEKQWGKPDMAYAVSALRAAVGRTEQALSVLEQEPNKAPVFVVQVLGLGFLVMYAQGALERAEQCVLDPLGQGSHREGPPRTAIDTVLPAGTIFCCPTLRGRTLHNDDGPHRPGYCAGRGHSPGPAQPHYFVAGGLGAACLPVLWRSTSEGRKDSHVPPGVGVTLFLKGRQTHECRGSGHSMWVSRFALRSEQQGGMGSHAPRKEEVHGLQGAVRSRRRHDGVLRPASPP
jgi:hypothetical protein